VSVAELSAIAPHPEGVRASIQWDVVQAALGTTLPDDYKELAELYGPGSFWGFIHLFQADDKYPALELVGQAAVNLEGLTYLQSRGEVIPYRIEGSESLLSCGRTDNGDVIYWVRERSLSPDGWTIAINAARDDRWFEYSGGIADFLLAIMAKILSVPIFPSALSRRAPSFQPY